ELKGFTRIHLAAGEAREVSFTLSRQHLEMLDADLRSVVEPGAFRVMVGASSRDIRLRGELVVRRARTASRSAACYAEPSRVVATSVERGDDDDTACAARSVDRGGGNVLQHVHLTDVFWMEAGKRGCDAALGERHAVEHDQRRMIVQ